MNKFRIIVALSLILICTIFLYFTSSKTKIVEKEQVPKNEKLYKEVEKVKKEIPADEEIDKQLFTVEIKANNYKKVQFSTSGKLEFPSENWKKGMTFKKNDLLFQLNNEKIFREILELKSELKASLESEVKNLEGSSKVKWQKFSENISETELLPQLPNLPKNELLLSKKIEKLINAIQKKEKEVSAYFYLAPFDGYFLSINSKENSTVNKTSTVALISFSNTLFVEGQFSSKIAKKLLSEKNYILDGKKITLDFVAKKNLSEDSIVLQAKLNKKLALHYPFMTKINMEIKN